MHLVLIIVGGLAALVGLLWLLGLAFSESPIWGLACLFIPIAALLFVAVRPSEAWKPALIYLVGAGCLLAGVSMAPG